MFRRLVVPAALTLAALSFFALAQAPAPPAPVFQSRTQEVIVPVTVTDPQGKFVSDLVKSDFHVFDENKEQKISYFSHTQAQPIVIGFLLDTSNTMKTNWNRYKESATELVLNLVPGDKRYSGYLITYGNKAQLEVDTSTDNAKMVEKIEKMKPGGGSALYDAIYMACTSRKTVYGEPYEPRRVIIIVGDGHDSASSKSLQEVIEIAQRKMVTIYAMSTAAFGMRVEGEDTLVELTSRTGGRVETPLNNAYKDVSAYLSKPQDAGNYALDVGTGLYTAQLSGALFRSVAALLGEITTQYVIRYTPDIAPGTEERVLRRIRVSVDLPTARVNAREGYYPFALQ